MTIDPRNSPDVQRITNRAMEQALANKRQFEISPEGQTVVMHVDWSAVPHYGYDHHNEVSTLACLIFDIHFEDSDGPFATARERNVVKYAALYHDLGRTVPWTGEDPGHALRSAELAEAVLKKDPNVERDPSLQGYLLEHVPRLIANHRLAGPVPQDPRAQSLWDADAYDGWRFANGTDPDGERVLRIMRERLAPERLCTPWAKDTDHQRRWRQYRGW